MHQSLGSAQHSQSKRMRSNAQDFSMPVRICEGCIACVRRLVTEVCVFLRLQLADGLEFELPSDVEEDEEIDEDMAFTAEDKIRYAGMFGDEPDDGEAVEEELLASDVSEDENFADVSALQSPVYTLLQGPLTVDFTEPTILVFTQDRSEDEAADAGSDSDDERRHAAMLADVRAAGDGNRKRKRRDVLMSEAYPESEYNLNPASGGGGRQVAPLCLIVIAVPPALCQFSMAMRTLASPVPVWIVDQLDAW